MNKEDLSKFYRFQMSIHAELLYRKGIWQSGARIGLPIMPLSKSNGPSNPVVAELIVRLALFSNSADKKEKLFVLNH